MGTTSSKTITITLTNAKPDIIQMEGFVKGNNYSLVYHIESGVTVAELLQHVNKYRMQPIHQLYFNQHIFTENERIYEHSTFFVRP